MDKIELTFRFIEPTKNKHKFQEELSDEAWSDRDTAIGTLYVEKQALEEIGNPNKLKVTIEPVKEKEG